MVHSASSPATDGQVPRGSLSVQSSNATTPLANKQVDPPVCQPGFKQKFTMLPFSGRQEEKVRPYQVATQTITSVPPQRQCTALNFGLHFAAACPPCGAQSSTRSCASASGHMGLYLLHVAPVLVWHKPDIPARAATGCPRLHSPQV